jgi:hypothetical protein
MYPDSKRGTFDARGPSDLDGGRACQISSTALRFPNPQVRYALYVNEESVQNETMLLLTKHPTAHYNTVQHTVTVHTSYHHSYSAIEETPMPAILFPVRVLGTQRRDPRPSINCRAISFPCGDASLTRIANSNRVERQTHTYMLSKSFLRRLKVVLRYPVSRIKLIVKSGGRWWCRC